MRRDVVSPVRTRIDHLRRRISNRLRRSGSSTLRRTVAGLLLAEQHCRTERTARVVLVAEDEVRLTARMHTHLRLSWCEHPHPAAVGQPSSSSGPRH
ncbi:GIY-YIG nuclease family protein [Rhodococcus zopfii]|uniref:GIY-YIG nuclease family protein n=1 Tax=Rhodococcus zopfii TaxID=43772 RepID=UPI001F103E26|nr:hypothetical protein [Rhodococcus zopfii]